MRRSAVALLVAGVLGAGVLAAPDPAAATEVPEATPRVVVVGDSLARQTYEVGSVVWSVDAKDGRSLRRATPRLRVAAASGADAVVVALGSNDVALGYGERAMQRDLDRVRRRLESVDCVVFTTVSPYGTFYRRDWRRVVRRFNRLVWATGHPVVNWNGLVTKHRKYVLADGVHLTRAGKAAYDLAMRTVVSRRCGLPAR